MLTSSRLAAGLTGGPALDDSTRNVLQHEVGRVEPTKPTKIFERKGLNRLIKERELQSAVGEGGKRQSG